MNWTLLFTLLIFTFQSNVNNKPLVQKFEGRFDYILLPNTNITYEGELHNYTTFVSPFFPLKPNFQATELCNDIEFKLKNFDPKLWNNSEISNPCTIYFCGEKEIYNDTNLHYGAQRYCYQCSLTLNQNFNNVNCSKFDKNYCQGQCSQDSSCIYFKQNFPLCYNWNTNQFYRTDDFTHLILIYFFYFVSPPLYLVVSFVYAMISLFLLIFPQIHHSIERIKEKETIGCYDTMREVFSLKNQSVVFFSITNVITFIAAILDVIGPYTGFYLNALGFSLFINYAFVFLGLNSVIILWIHICQIDIYTDDKLSKFNCLTYFIILFLAFVFGTSGFLLYFQYGWLDNGQHSKWNYFLGSYSLILGLLGGVLILILIFVSFRMYFKFSSIRSGTGIFEFSKSAFKLKVRNFN